MGIFNLKSKSELVPNMSLETYIKDYFRAGEIVTVDNALTIPAFSASAKVIAESIAMLPLKLMHNYKGKSRVVYDKNEYKILAKEANEYTTAEQFKKNMTFSYLLYGNAFAEKVYALDGSIINLNYINPKRVTGISITNGKLIYTIDGKQYGRDKIFHLTGMEWDESGYKGKSVIDTGREILGLALAVYRYSRAFFENGATPATLLITSQDLPKDKSEMLLKNWNRKNSSAKNSHKAAILPPTIKDIKTIGTDAEKSQLLQTRKETVIDICRLFRMPPHLIQSLDGATFSNIEEQAKEFVTNTLMPHLTKWEQACNQQLIQPKDKDYMFYKYNVDALERGKLIERYQAHTLAINAGWKSRNEVRETEDMNRVDGLDEYVRLGNLIENRKD